MRSILPTEEWSAAFLAERLRRVRGTGSHTLRRNERNYGREQCLLKAISRKVSKKECHELRFSGSKFCLGSEFPANRENTGNIPVLWRTRHKK
jgi:hypothetical protein